MNASKILFRCSSLGALMVEAKNKSEKISETTKGHLLDVFIQEKYGRKEEKNNKFLTKGNEREQDSITLLSLEKKHYLKKNEEHLSNEFIKGTPDIFIGEDILKADEIFDTKTSWSAHTFFRAINKKLDTDYYWQVMGYMALTGAKKAHIAFCLVNGTAQAIMDEKRKLAYHMGILDTSKPNEKYKEVCKQIEKNHIFDMAHFKEENPFFDFDNDLDEWVHDIPRKDRLHIFTVERNDAEIQKIYNRIEDCRAWMDQHLFKTEIELIEV